MPYCEKCGTKVNPEANFCINCGAKLNQTQAQVSRPVQTAPIQPTSFMTAPTQPQAQPATAYQPPEQTYQPPVAPQAPVAPMPQPAAPTPTPEQTPNVQPQIPPQQRQVIGAIALRRPKSFGRSDSYTGVITAQQFIVAQMTSSMVSDAAMQARDQAKANGKGFFGQWSEQLKASFGYTKKYLEMDPAAIIAETPGNFAIDNNSISEIRLKTKYLDQDNNRQEWEVQIHSFSGSYEFRMEDNNDFVELLKNVYPNRVKMPFGYFSKSGLKVKFF